MSGLSFPLQSALKSAIQQKTLDSGIPYGSIFGDNPLYRFSHNFVGVNISFSEFAPVSNSIDASIFASHMKNIDFWCSYIGAKYIRLPFAVERMFTGVAGSINASFLANYKTLVDRVLYHGAIPILDMHSFGKFSVSGVNKILGSVDFTVAQWAELWRLLALEFNYDETIEFDLMNEPDLITMTPIEWVDALITCIDAIRGAGVAENYIHVEFQAASGIPYVFNYISGISRAKQVKRVGDYDEKIIIHVHGYVDKNFNGGSNGGGGDDLSTNSDNDLSRYLNRLFIFARDEGLKIFIGECNGGDNAGAYLAIANIMQDIYYNRDVARGICLWGGGNIWGDYELSTDPDFSDGKFNIRPMVNVILNQSKYIGNNSGFEFDFNFWENTFTHTVTDNLGCTRSTSAYLYNRSGAWSSFGVDTLRYNNNGLYADTAHTNLVARDWFGGGTLVNLTRASGLTDFVGTDNAYSLTDSGAGSIAHRLSIDATAVLAVSQSYTWQYLIDFEDDYFDWGEAQFPATARISSYFSGDYRANAGQWKQRFTRITRDATTSTIRTQIGIQPDDALAASSTPDSYTASGKIIKVCSPMVTLGSRLRMPIMSASANALCDGDDIPYIGALLSAMQSDSFVLVMCVFDLNEIAEITELLTINGTVALRKNTDNSIGGDFVATVATTTPFNTTTNFRSPRRVGICVDKTNGKIHIGIEGLAVVTATGSIPTITSAKVGQCGGFYRFIRLQRGVFTEEEFYNLLERA